MMPASTLGLKAETSLTRRISVIICLATTFAAIASLLITLTVFEDGLRSQLMAKASAAGDVVRRDIATALDLGVPFDELRGLDKLAGQTAAEVPEIASVEILRDTALAHERPSTSTDWHDAVTRLMPVGQLGVQVDVIHQDIVWNNQTLGTILIGLDPDHVAKQMRNAFFDTLIILIATTLISLELIALLIGRALIAPLRIAHLITSHRAAGNLFTYRVRTGDRVVSGFVGQLNDANRALFQKAVNLADQARARVFIWTHNLNHHDNSRTPAIIDARIPLFVFCFAEELQKSFLPLFVAEAYKPNDLFGVDVMMGLPISAFMLVIALLTPFAGKLIEKHGSRTLFMAGLAPAIFGCLICAMATSGNDIVFGRSITAIGYAIITISCQSYIAKVTLAGNRAKGMAVFVGVLMTATLCGTAVGAILADRLGYRPVFYIAAVIAAFAGVLGLLMLDHSPDAGQSKTARANTDSVMPLLRSHRFLLIVLLCAIPTKIVLTGFLYLLVPIYLAGLDVSQSEIGRIMMVYSLVIVPISPIAAGVADRIGQNLKVAVFAMLGSGIVLFGFATNPNAAGVLAIVLGLGIAHSFLKAPLIVSVMETAETIPDVSVTTALGLLRTCERAGSFVGPVLVAALMIYFSDMLAATIIGVTVSVSALAFLALLRSRPVHAGIGRIIRADAQHP